MLTAVSKVTAAGTALRQAFWGNMALKADVAGFLSSIINHCHARYGFFQSIVPQAVGARQAEGRDELLLPVLQASLCLCCHQPPPSPAPTPTTCLTARGGVFSATQAFSFLSGPRCKTHQLSPAPKTLNPSAQTPASGRQEVSSRMSPSGQEPVPLLGADLPSSRPLEGIEAAAAARTRKQAQLVPRGMHGKQRDGLSLNTLAKCSFGE